MAALLLLQVVLVAVTAVGGQGDGGLMRDGLLPNESCSGNFFLLEQSLLQSTGNRFRLLQAFYPLNEAHPVLVRVQYNFEGLDNHSTQIWFWTESHYYLIQPLEIFQFTSLLFANMPYRQGSISILLDADCSLAPREYFQLLTARVS